MSPKKLIKMFKVYTVQFHLFNGEKKVKWKYIAMHLWMVKLKKKRQESDYHFSSGNGYF